MLPVVDVSTASYHALEKSIISQGGIFKIEESTYTSITVVRAPLAAAAVVAMVKATTLLQLRPSLYHHHRCRNRYCVAAQQLRGGGEQGLPTPVVSRVI